MQGKRIPTVLEQLKAKGEELRLEDIVFEGFGGVLCVEAGGPTPGIGCAGRGIISAFEKLEELNAFEVYKPDIVIYDVLGDVVCGGFAMPIRGGYAREVFIVSSGEMMALYAANNIAQAIKNFGKRGYARLGGIILNAKNIADEQELVAKAAAEIGTQVVQYVPRSGDIQIAENMGGTVSEFTPASPMVAVYRSLAETVLALSEDVE
jgi:nitrogenase iron protein NifH